MSLSFLDRFVNNQLNQPGIYKIIFKCSLYSRESNHFACSSKYFPNAIYFFHPLFSKSSMIMDPYKTALYQTKEIENSTTVK